MNFAAAALAMLAERLAGYPAPLFDRIGHPVTWIGWVIGWTDRNLNRPGAGRREGRLRGTLALALILVAAALPAWALAGLLGDGWIGWIVQIALATSLIAQKSLRDHVRDVRTALDRSLDDARRAVSRIVGRDPAQLDESGIARAALESLAENASDGVVAPVFWLALLGLPGLAAYKAINTADSMIGHRSEAYIHFGWASARTDDLVNIPASRLTGLLFAAATPARFGEILRVMRRDAPRHGSPNAGWPEAAMAAALRVTFGGPRSYGGETVALPTMGEGRTNLERADIDRGLALFARAMWLLVALLAGLAVIL